MVFSQTEISNVVGLAAISGNLSGSYILTADITLTSDWTPIVGFTGTLDGNGHTISSLTVNQSTTAERGLFSTTIGATIRRLGIESASVIGNERIGAIVGLMTGGLIEECYVSNSYVEGRDHVGSFCGQIKGGADIQNCYANGNVYSRSYQAGGIVGVINDNNTKISKCYFSGIVRCSTNSRPAGIVAWTDTATPTIEYCVNLAPFILGKENLRVVGNTIENMIGLYSISTCKLSSDINNYNGGTVPTSDGNYGTTKRHGANITGGDANAKTSAFYTSIGWDFINTWKMLGDGYPVLKWQTAPIKTSVLNILNVTNYALHSGNEIDFSKLISSHGINLNVSCTSPKVTISIDKIATISSGTTITAAEDVSVDISTVSSDFTITNSVGTLKLSPGIPFPNFTAYPNGIISDIYNAGPGLAIDKTSVTTEDSKMVVISSTNVTTFNAYIQNLLSSGFTQIATNSIDNNVFYTLMNNNKLYYLYFNASNNQVRVIQDNSSRTLLNALDASTQGTGKTEFYIYSLDYTHGEGQTSKTDYWKIDCGAMLIIKLKDNSLFIVDAGHERQSSKAAMEGLLNFMYQITGQEEGTTLNIRSWFFSHAHGDHVYMVYPFLEKYHELLNVESVLFNIPSYQTMSSGYDAGTFLMKQTFNKYYPNCKYVKLHTGQHFSLQGVSFDVLFTHEDGVTAAGVTTIGNFNDTSTILQITMDGKKIMLLGDTDGIGQSNMLSMFSGATLKSDCVQTSHHGYNDVTSLYNAIKAPLAFYCNSITNAKDNNMSKYLGAVNAASNVKALFADPYTIKITVENGSFQTENLPSYRSYFTTVKIPNLSVGTINTSGNTAALSTVLNQTSLNDQVIDKSVTGTGSKTVSESCSLILDGTTSTKYCTDSIPATIAWTMKKPVTLKWYVIYTANDNAGNPGRNPQKWVISGSNDGTNWTNVDSVNNANLPDVNYTGIAFAVSNPVPYQYYAIKVFSTAGAGILQLSEIGLYGDVNLSTAISNNYDDINKSINIYTIGNNQIIINCEGDISDETTLSVYNMIGKRLVNKLISDVKTIVSVPISGIYIAEVKNSKGKTIKKISLK